MKTVRKLKPKLRAPSAAVRARVQHVHERLAAANPDPLVAHGNSLRSIVMKLDALSREQVLELNMDTGVPYVYELDEKQQVKARDIRK